jgi:transcriptional regulator GlxA family with amidase domain
MLPMKHAPDDRRRIGLIVFPGITALDFIGPMEAFNAAKIDTAEGRKRPCYELTMIGVNRKPATSESGAVFKPHCTLESAPPLDTVLIPGGTGLRRPETTRKLTAWLMHRVHHTRRIVSVCTGIYGLAPTGLLDGRRVTTHWAHARDVAQRFPKLLVDANALFLKDGKFYTSAGITAGIDVTLALIEEDFGPGVALSVARELVVYLKRSGDQAQFSDPLRFQSRSTGGFADLTAWIRQNLGRPLPVDQLAQRVALGPRHFSRRFKATFDVSPAEFVELQRMNEARHRLTLPRTSIDSVARSVGFNSADVFRRAFERRFGVTPTAYRRQFASTGGLIKVKS